MQHDSKSATSKVARSGSDMYDLVSCCLGRCAGGAPRRVAMVTGIDVLPDVAPRRQNLEAETCRCRRRTARRLFRNCLLGWFLQIA
jgi:hypothetical protein